MAPGRSTTYFPTPSQTPSGEAVRVTIYEPGKPPRQDVSR